MNSAELIKNLRDEADLCRNETATDIADLLDDAASALIATGALFSALKDERNALAARVRELEEERCCTCRDGALKQPYSTMPPLQTLPWGTEK